MSGEALRPIRTETGPFLLNFEAEVSRLSPEVQKPINAFIYSETFDQFIEKARKLRPGNLEGLNEFIGRFFEQFCYFYLTGDLAQDQFLLSPKKTEDFYQALGIPEKGTTIPDGIIFSKKDGITTISAFCEYTAQFSIGPRRNRQMWYYQSSFLGNQLDDKLKLAGLVLNRFLPGHFPQKVTWAANSEFKVVLLKLQESSPINLNSEVFRQIFLPLTGRDFADLVDALFCDTNHIMVRRTFPRQL